MEELIAKRYAVALLELSDSKVLQNQIASLENMVEALATDRIKEIVESPLVSNSDKFKSLVEPLKGSIDDTLYKLIAVMSQKGRLNLLPELLDIIKFEMKKRSNEFEGTIESDKSLTNRDIKNLEKTLQRYSGAKITLKKVGETEDGIRVKVEDLGLELNFSKSRVKADLLAYIQQAI